jgi:hypothetical protein
LFQKAKNVASLTIVRTNYECPFSLHLYENGIIAVLTGTVGLTSKRSLLVRPTVTGPAPCSGAERRNKELDEVSTAIHGGGAAVNDTNHRQNKDAERSGADLFCPSEFALLGAVYLSSVKVALFI